MLGYRFECHGSPGMIIINGCPVARSISFNAQWPCVPGMGQNLQSFTGDGYVSIWVKNSRVGQMLISWFFIYFSLKIVRDLLLVTTEIFFGRLKILIAVKITQNTSPYCLYVCLIGVWRPTREFFTHMESSPLPVKDCKFWPMLGTYDHCGILSTYCKEGNPFIIVISEEPWYSNLLPTVWQCSCHYLCLRLRSVAGWDSNTQLSAFVANALRNCATAAATLTVCQSPTH